jgi:hypothetical protein
VTRKNSNAATGDGGARQKVSFNRNVPANTEIAGAAQVLPIDEIRVGERYRRDLGDIAGLAESITLQYGCALELLRRALLCDAQGRASTPLDATTAESEAMR